MLPLLLSVASKAFLPQSMDIWDDEDELTSQAKLADREWNRLQEGFMNDGYREGITAGKEGALQEGFDEGFALDGVPLGRRVGTLRGIAAGLQAFGTSGLTGTSSNSPSQSGQPSLEAEVRAIVAGLENLEIGDLMPPDLLAEQHNLEHEQAEAQKQHSESAEVDMEGDISGGGDSMEEMLAAFASVGTKDSATTKTRRREQALAALRDLEERLSSVLQQLGLAISLED